MSIFPRVQKKRTLHSARQMYCIVESQWMRYERFSVSVLVTVGLNQSVREDPQKLHLAEAFKLHH